ncbi:putative protein F54H12.2-like protein [Aphelenchoides besseyi]|nr:putative protein F54H12.2-like protein [Aphelenchoides besseyi]
MVQILFDPSTVEFSNFFQNTQIGSGDIYKGQLPFQRGFGSVRTQYGTGIGSVLSSLWRTLLPVLRSVGSSVGKEALSTGGRILENLSKEGKLSETFKKTEARQGARNLAQKLKEMFAESREVQLVGRIPADLFNQENLLLNNLEMNIEIMPHDSNFCLMQPQTNVDNYKLQITQCKLYVKFCDLVDSLSLSFNTKLQLEPARSSVRRTEIKNLELVAGRMDFYTNLYSETIPKRIIIGMVDSRALNGNSSLSPFNFRPFDVREITVSAGGHDFPGVSYDLDFNSYQFTRAYHDMCLATGFAFSDKGHKISMKRFKDGWTLFCFDLSTNAASSNHFDLIKLGATNLSIKFRYPTPATGVNVVIYSEFDGCVLIDKNRVVTTDLTV